MADIVPCGCSKKSEWHYRGKWHELPVSRCGDCGTEVNGCRKHGDFLSVKKWEYLCNHCLEARQRCSQCGERHLNHQREGGCL